MTLTFKELQEYLRNKLDDGVWKTLNPTTAETFRKYYEGDWTRSMFEERTRADMFRQRYEETTPKQERTTRVDTSDLEAGDVVRFDPDPNGYGDLLVIGEGRDLTMLHKDCDETCIVAVQTGEKKRNVKHSEVEDKNGTRQPWIMLNSFTSQVLVEEVKEERVDASQLNPGDRIRIRENGKEGIYLGKAGDFFHPFQLTFYNSDFHVMEPSNDDTLRYVDKAGKKRNWYTFGGEVTRLDPVP